MMHIIREQYLHVELKGTEADGLALQCRLPDLFQHWVMPAIEGVFERCAPPDRHLYIERLEMDAGTIALERLEQDLAEAVAQTLDKSLREHIPLGESHPPIISGTIEHKTSQQVIQEVFIHFLETGSLPWSFRLPEGSNLEQVILGLWREAAKSGLNPLAGSDAVLRVLAGAAARKRLIRQFSPALLETLLSLISPVGKKVMDTVLQTLGHAEAPSVLRKYFAQQLWETAFAQTASRRAITATNLVGEAWGTLPEAVAGHTSLADVVERLWPDITNRAPDSAHRMEGNEPTPPHLVGPDKAQIISNGHPDVGEDIFHEPIMPNPPTPDKTPIGRDKSFVAGEGIDSEPMPSNLPGSNKTPIIRSVHPGAGEGIYVENAGLVLLHPFLPQFFESLGIAAAENLLQPERALCVLHFLSTGQDIAPEYELVLPKILCNIPLLSPVETDLQPTGPEKEEAVALLKAVIRHWEALRNSSPDGLRGTFLLRPGKVSEREDGDWLLQVESRTFDILLQQLPWGISMIQLPWMKRMLWVEWG